MDKFRINKKDRPFKNVDSQNEVRMNHLLKVD